MAKKEDELTVELGEGSSSSLDLAMSNMSLRGRNFSTRTSVPYHLPNIPRPQDEYNIFVNNFNEPFVHVWLERSEDGTNHAHPLEKLSVVNFIDDNIGSIEPVHPLPMENTPFKLVEELKELKQLAATLSSVNEFAVDLEHNQYRSFLGLTCLMQISTRLEDFVVDTLKLRVYVGPYLREVFKDPSKKKVMHGADRDVMWLQRDFGIYICNLFDTQQASRALELERNSLEHLLLYFCGVSVNKAYQNADWRLRPLPDDMLKYAREDTHYLLYIYDLMSRRLLIKANGGITLLSEVYRRSSDVCMQLYQKELLTSTSYVYTYGLQEAKFNSQQLSIVAGLCAWRDAVARAEDESTGYILPNRTLIDIARQMPITALQLLPLVKSKHPYVEVNLDSIIDIIHSSISNAAVFEPVAQLLKNKETVTQQDIEEASFGSCLSFSSCQGSSLQLSGEVGEIKKEQDGLTPNLPKKSFTLLGQTRDTCTDQFSGATEGVLDKPSHDFGLGNSPSKSEFDTHLKFSGEIEEVVNSCSHDFGLGISTLNSKIKTDPIDEVEQIKSCNIFPFQSSISNNEHLKLLARSSNQEIPSPNDYMAMITRITKLEEVTSLGRDPADEEPLHNFPTAVNNGFENKEDAETEGSKLEAEVETISLSNLSSRFRKCFQLKQDKENTKQIERNQELDCGLQLRAFDSSAATKQMRFRQGRKEEMLTDGDVGFKSLLDERKISNGSIISRFREDGVTKGFRQGKQYQALLHAGSQTFG